MNSHTRGTHRNAAQALLLCLSLINEKKPLGTRLLTKERCATLPCPGAGTFVLQGAASAHAGRHAGNNDPVHQLVSLEYRLLRQVRQESLYDTLHDSLYDLLCMPWQHLFSVSLRCSLHRVSRYEHGFTATGPAFEKGPSCSPTPCFWACHYLFSSVKRTLCGIRGT